jgi:hypothetical protein
MIVFPPYHKPVLFFKKDFMPFPFYRQSILGQLHIMSGGNGHWNEEGPTVSSNPSNR